MNVEFIIGEELSLAESTINQHGYTLREVQKNGCQLGYSCEFEPNRVNVATKNGIVTSICSIG